jgi:hypothetical protein
MISGAQIKAARMLLNWDVSTLARSASQEATIIALETVKDLGFVTDVRLVGSDEQILVQGELGQKSRPREVKGGVEFFVI